MPGRRYQKTASFRVAPLLQTVVVNINNSTAADATFNLFRVPRRCELRRATYIQTAAATAATSYTATLQNGSTNISNALDIKALGANGSAEFSLVGVPVLNRGDVIKVFFNETGGTVTAPGVVGIALELAVVED